MKKIRYIHSKIAISIITIIATTVLQFAVNAQSLIFHSGFELGTYLTGQSSSGADIQGTDNSVSSPNNWVTDLEGSAYIGTVGLQYQDYDANQQAKRKAELVNDPTGSGMGQVLKYWMTGDNVSYDRGRIQMNMYGAGTGITEYYQKMSMYLPSESFNPIISDAGEVEFLTIIEIWNNNNWAPAFGTAGAYPFRMKVNITKEYGSGQNLYLTATGEEQTQNCCWGEGSDKYWEEKSRYQLPLDTWFDLELYIKEGNASTGKFKLALTPAGGSKQVLFDVTGHTYNPSDPSPDGIKFFNPIKMYTKDFLTIDKATAAGDSLKIYWDDFELYRNKTIDVTGATIQQTVSRVTDIDGTFYIENVFSNKVMQVAGSSTSNGANIEQSTNVSGDNQKWVIEKQSDGYYTIKSVLSDKIIEMQDWSTANGGNARQYTDYDQNNQKWKIIEVEPDVYKIENVHSGRILEVAGWSTSDGGNIRQWEWLNQSSHKWELNPASSAFQQGTDSNGIVSMETEQFSSKIAGAGTYAGMDWTEYSNGSASDDKYMMVPNRGNTNSGSSTDSPVLNFDIDFVKSGTHYIWMRVIAPNGSNNSITLRYNTSLVTEWHLPEYSTFTWVKCSSTFSAAIGTNTFKLYMREDGTQVDKIVLTTNAGYTPSGEGPAQSRSATHAMEQDDFQARHVAVYPNPADNYFTLDVGEADNISITLFNYLGQTVKQELIGQGAYKVDVSDVKSGIYFIRIANGTQTTTKKLIIR